MANWITHIRIADKLLEYDLPLDARGFCIGSIAPDCNIENADWSSFEPSREVTHFMTGKSKLTADFDGFFSKYIQGKSFSNEEEKSFFLGYYAHLITDVEFTKFIREEERVRNMYARIKERADLWELLKGKPESFDTVKSTFDKAFRTRDLIHFEQKYILEKPKSLYNTILRKIENFPDYIDILPKDAIARKIPIMAYEVTSVCPAEFIVFTEEEYEKFVDQTVNLIYEKIKRIK